MRTIPSLLAVAVVSLTATGASAGTQADVAACLAELETSGAASAADYRAKFKGVRGGGMKTMTFELKSTNGGADKTAVCKVRRGKVVDISLEG
ncbi:MAG: hypothetical protein AAFY22_10500 [Pseudomonadota bacterium]